MSSQQTTESTPRIIAVIGARLNSSRLPGKQLLDLAGKPLIEHIFARLDRVECLSACVLATTADTYNQPLVDWARNAGRECFAYTGDVDDLVGRVDQVVQKYGADYLVYICGDSPLIDPGFISRALNALMADPKASAIHIPPVEGRPIIHEGIDIYPRFVWDQTVEISKSEMEREHVGLARKKLYPQQHFAVLDEDPIYHALDHRLSVDTPSDYRFMSIVYKRWYENHGPEEIVSLRWLIEELLKDAELRGINAEVMQKRADQSSSRILYVTAAGPGIGLGHMSRTITAIHGLQDTLGAGVTLLIAGLEVVFRELDLIPHKFSTSWQQDLRELVGNLKPKSIVFDLPKTFLHEEDGVFLGQFQEQGIDIISIDFSIPWLDIPCFNWVPCFYLDEGKAFRGKHFHGWDCYLLPERNTVPAWEEGRNLLVLSGGGDVHQLGEALPQLLLEKLPEDFRITWIRGPYSKPPQIPADLASRVQVIFQPREVLPYIAKSQYALIAYGLSFFEALQMGLPCVTLTLGQDPEEMQALEQQQVCLQADTPAMAIAQLERLINEPELCQEMSQKACKLIDGKGAVRLARCLQSKWENVQA